MPRMPDRQLFPLFIYPAAHYIFLCRCLKATLRPKKLRKNTNETTNKKWKRQKAFQNKKKLKNSSQKSAKMKVIITTQHHALALWHSWNLASHAGTFLLYSLIVLAHPKVFRRPTFPSSCFWCMHHLIPLRATALLFYNNTFHFWVGIFGERRIGLDLVRLY